MCRVRLPKGSAFTWRTFIHLHVVHSSVCFIFNSVSASPMLNANASIVLEFLFFSFCANNEHRACFACLPYIFCIKFILAESVFLLCKFFLQLVLQLDGKVCFAESWWSNQVVSHVSFFSSDVVVFLQLPHNHSYLAQSRIATNSST